MDASAAESARRLSHLLRERREDLICSWVRRVQDDPRVSGAGRLSEPELRDHVPKLLDCIARGCECSEGADACVAISDANRTAREHARHRLSVGYPLTQEQRELSHLRAAILDACAAERVRVHISVARLLHAVIDEIMISGTAEMERAWRDGEEERRATVESERAARSEAERAAHLRDEFVATVSHELRTPLNAILGWIGMLRRGGLGEVASAKALEVIERNARALAELVEDLLDMSRIGSGKLRLDVRRVELAGVIENAVAAHMPAATAKGVRLSKDLGSCHTPVEGDPARLEQIVSNLISNAIKFTPAGGSVGVLCRAGPKRVRITVQDTGKGIDPAFLPHVFDRFRQAEASLTRQHHGLGLGLSLVKFLVEQHGGTVHAASKGVGRGATFTVSFPLAGGSHAEAPSPLDAMRAIEGVRVLVVDDEQDARDLVTRLLEECRAEVVAAASTTEALERIQRARPDVIVSDIGMPELDGYQLIRAVRALSPEQGGATPAVALTAFARPEDRLRALRAGYQMHVAKPVDQNELLVALASVAGRLPS